jgi:hypothetical protein
LVYQSICHALIEFIKDHEAFFPNANTIDASDQFTFAVALECSLNEIEVSFDSTCFDQPHKLPFLDYLNPVLIQWLTKEAANAQAFYPRFKGRFVLVLHKQWLAKPSEYACIEAALKSPFVQATTAQRCWM